MKYGLRDSDISYITKSIEQFDEINKAVIFGSRAMGNHKQGSDIDLAIYGENVNFDTVSNLHAILEDEGPMPYFIDVVDATHLTQKELKDHIERVGQIIFERE